MQATRKDTDTALEGSAKQAPSSASSSLFFARVPPAVPYEELHQLFSQHGDVKLLNLYRRWATAKTSKGCGIVEFGDQASAVAAMAALNGSHTFDGHPGYEGPMVVEAMDVNRLSAAGKAAANPKKKPHKQRTPAAAHNNTSSSTGGSSTGSSSSGSTKAAQDAAQHHLRNDPAHNNRAACRPAAAAAAAAAAAGVPRGPCGWEAFGLASALMQQQQWAACDAAAGYEAGGLGDPSTWTSYTPMHLLPMAQQMHRMAPQPPAYSPGLSPTAAAAASAAAAAAVEAAATAAALSAMGGGIGPDLLLMGACNRLSPIAGRDSDYLLMHSSALNTQGSPTQLSAFNLPPAGCPGSSQHALQAAAARVLPPLMLPDDAPWAQQDSYIASLRGSCALASPNSDSFSLWDPLTASGRLQDAGAAYSAQAWLCPSPSTPFAGGCLPSSSALSAPAAVSGAFGGSRHEGDLSGVLPGRLQHLLSPGQGGTSPRAFAGAGGAGYPATRTASLEECMVLPAAAADTGSAGGLGMQQPQQRAGSGVELQAGSEFSLEAGEAVLRVVRATGARISITAWPRLYVQGSDAQVQAACELLAGCAAMRRLESA